MFPRKETIHRSSFAAPLTTWRVVRRPAAVSPARPPARMERTNQPRPACANFPVTTSARARTPSSRAAQRNARPREGVRRPPRPSLAAAGDVDGERNADPLPRRAVASRSLAPPACAHPPTHHRHSRRGDRLDSPVLCSPATRHAPRSASQASPLRRRKIQATSAAPSAPQASRRRVRFPFRLS